MRLLDCECSDRPCTHARGPCCVPRTAHGQCSRLSHKLFTFDKKCQRLTIKLARRATPSLPEMSVVLSFEYLEMSSMETCFDNILCNESVRANPDANELARCAVQVHAVAVEVAATASVGPTLKDECTSQAELTEYCNFLAPAVMKWNAVLACLEECVGVLLSFNGHWSSAASFNHARMQLLSHVAAFTRELDRIAVVIFDPSDHSSDRPTVASVDACYCTIASLANIVASVGNVQLGSVLEGARSLLQRDATEATAMSALQFVNRRFPTIEYFTDYLTFQAIQVLAMRAAEQLTNLSDHIIVLDDAEIYSRRSRFVEMYPELRAAFSPPMMS